MLDEVGRGDVGALVCRATPGSPSPVHTSPPPAWAAGRHAAALCLGRGAPRRLRAELDALYAHLYGLTREELAYILDTFPIVRRKDEAQVGGVSDEADGVGELRGAGGEGWIFESLNH